MIPLLFIFIYIYYWFLACFGEFDPKSARPPPSVYMPVSHKTIWRGTLERFHPSTPLVMTRHPGCPLLGKWCRYADLLAFVMSTLLCSLAACWLRALTMPPGMEEPSLLSSSVSLYTRGASIRVIHSSTLGACLRLMTSWWSVMYREPWGMSGVVVISRPEQFSFSPEPGEGVLFLSTRTPGLPRKKVLRFSPWEGWSDDYRLRVSALSILKI